MKVNVERDIDVERLLVNFSEKSKCSSVGMTGYDVIVIKQMQRYGVVMKKIKERKKKFIRRCKNGTVFYIDTYGDRWSNCEPFKVLFVKHNQYLIDRNGCFLKISSMNEKGYEFSVYLFEDLKKRNKRYYWCRNLWCYKECYCLSSRNVRGDESN